MGNFSDEKRERVARQLRESGRELFAQHGLQKTTISDLTDSAGISTGAFYQFYDSKEDLCVELLEEAGHQTYTRAVSESFEEYDDPEKAIETFLRILLDTIENDLLIYRILADDDLNQLVQYRGESQMKGDRQAAITYLIPHIEKWYDAGEIDGPSPETIGRSIRAIRFLALHEEEIGSDHYHEVKETVISAIARGLTCQSE